MCSQIAKSPYAANIAVAYGITDGGVFEDESIPVEPGQCGSVLNMGMFSEHHVHEAGMG